MATNASKTPITEDILIGGNASTEEDKAGTGAAPATGGELQQEQRELTEEELDKQKLMAEYKEELVKIQEDIVTLKLVLNDKLKRENELKTLLGYSFVDDMKQDINEGINSIKSTTAFKSAADTFSALGSSVSQNETYQKTAASMKTATEKVTPTISTIGTSMKTSLSNLANIRNSTMFKSLGESVSSTFQNGKMKSSQSEYGVVNNNGNDGSGMNNGNNKGMSGSQSTLGTTQDNGGISKQDTILED
jgi:hypothetical protein